MVVDKEKIKKKMLKKFDDDERIRCSICNEVIPRYDIEDLKFEYCKSGLGENYAHSECVRKMIKK